MTNNVFDIYNMSRSISSLCGVAQRYLITYFNIFKDEVRLEIIDNAHVVVDMLNTLDIQYMQSPTGLIVINGETEIDKLVTYLRLTNNLYQVK